MYGRGVNDDDHVYKDDDDDFVNNDDFVDNDDFFFPANSPHDKISPWWEYVINR